MTTTTQFSARFNQPHPSGHLKNPKFREFHDLDYWHLINVQRVLSDREVCFIFLMWTPEKRDTWDKLIVKNIPFDAFEYDSEGNVSPRKRIDRVKALKALEQILTEANKIGWQAYKELIRQEQFNEG